MGLFGSDEDSGPAEKLATNARGDSVTSDVLTVTTKRLENDYLTVKPLIDVLEQEEQPQYFYYNASKGVEKGGNSVGDGRLKENRSLCLITDQRVLFFTNGNEATAASYAAVEDVWSKNGLTKGKLTIIISGTEYSMQLSENKGELEDAAEYVQRQAGSAGVGETGLTSIPDFRQIWEPSSNGKTRSIAERLPENDEMSGSYVTPDRIKKVVDILDPNEVVHYLTRGTTVDVEGSGAGGSLFGDDRSRKTGTRGYVRAIITNRRVAVKVPQMLGNDERSVPYTNITSVDLDTGLVNKRLTLQTAGQTYHIEAQEPGKEELRNITQFIRKKISESNQPNTVKVEDSDPEPLEQLEKLKSLHDQDIVDDAEFVEKKSDLLDKI